MYALRHREEGLLYIGQAKHLRDRLRGGHKAFLWGWLDRYDPEDVGGSDLPAWAFHQAWITIRTREAHSTGNRATLQRENTEGLMTQTISVERLSSEAAHHLLEVVPSYVKEAFHHRATEIEYPIEAVVEMALANFLDEESLSFEDCLLSERLDAVA